MRITQSGGTSVTKVTLDPTSWYACYLMEHFRASALRDVGGWDAWNVTEDADLGLRLARFGYAAAMLDSTTREEAPARLDIWIKQRRRWTKGWMQTALVLARDPGTFRDLRAPHVVAVTLMLINLVIGPLASPVVILLAVWQMSRGVFGGPSAALACVVSLTAIASTVWCGWAGARARGLGRLVPWLPLLLPYQLLIAFAAWGGLWDLALRPYHWRKTPHGAEARGLNRSSRAAPPQRRRALPPPLPG